MAGGLSRTVWFRPAQILGPAACPDVENEIRDYFFRFRLPVG
jgi:hypothetical protein